MVTLRAAAMSRKACQNSASSETEVLWPRKVSECLAGRSGARLMVLDPAHGHLAGVLLWLWRRHRLVFRLWSDQIWRHWHRPARGPRFWTGPFSLRAG